MSWVGDKNKPIRFWLRSADPAYQWDTKRKPFSLAEIRALLNAILVHAVVARFHITHCCSEPEPAGKFVIKCIRLTRQQFKIAITITLRVSKYKSTKKHRKYKPFKKAMLKITTIHTSPRNPYVVIDCKSSNFCSLLVVNLSLRGKRRKA